MENEPTCVVTEENTKTKEVVIPSESSELNIEEAKLDTNAQATTVGGGGEEEETNTENADAIEIESSTENDAADPIEIKNESEETTNEVKATNENESESEKQDNVESAESNETQAEDKQEKSAEEENAQPVSETTENSQVEEEQKESSVDNASKEGLVDKLKELDTENTGFLEIDEIKVIISKLYADMNLVLEDEDFNKKIESVEKNQNGKINFQELVKKL